MSADISDLKLKILNEHVKAGRVLLHEREHLASRMPLFWDPLGELPFLTVTLTPTHQLWV